MRFGVMYSLYQCVVLLLLPVVFVVLLITTRGRRRLWERLGFWRHVPTEVDWWIHAASLGEAQGVISFIRKLREESPDAQILLTGTSPTGLEALQQEVDCVRLLPIDSALLVSLVLRSVSVKRVVITETEIWPSLLQGLFSRRVPVHIINGRISDYTFSLYRFTRWFFSPLLGRVSSVSVPDATQAKRYEALGVSKDRIFVTGHTKYDSGVDCTSGVLTREALFPAISSEEKILTLGCLRSGEEDVWFPCIERMWSEGKNLKVVVVPRHAERFEYFWQKITSLTSRCRRFSELENSGQGPLTDYDILLVDTIGILRDVYRISDGAFIGATLVDIGGHNPFEAAMFGIPVVVGPYISVIAELISDMREQGGVIEVQTKADVERFLRDFTNGSVGLVDTGRAGEKVFKKHGGATTRVLEVLRSTEAEREVVCA